MSTLRPLVAVILACALGACSYVTPTAAWTDGRLALAARFPQAQRALQVIPEGTQRIEVRVTGAGIPQDAVLAATLTPDKTQATFADVPEGPKQVTAKAYDGDGAVVAAGSAQVTIVAGATVLARIRLALLTDEGNFELVLE